MAAIRHETARLIMASTWGSITVTATREGVTDCTLTPLAERPESPFAWMDATVEGAASARKHLGQSERFIKACFRGKACRRPPLSRPSATPFRCAVWAEMERIPSGSTLSYGEIAERIGKPGGARAVGNACGANPLPLFIPCHRVVAAGGCLGGFSSGTAWKKLLLDREQRGRK